MIRHMIPERWFVLAYFALGIFIMAVSYAPARDDGRYAKSPLKPWFDSLRSERGPCCSDADGARLEASDWEATATGYRVFIEGAWHDVPPDAMVTVPNIHGSVFVWQYKEHGKLIIRCFLPGALS